VARIQVFGSENYLWCWRRIVVDGDDVADVVDDVGAAAVVDIYYYNYDHNSLPEDFCVYSSDCNFCIYYYHCDHLRSDYSTLDVYHLKRKYCENLNASIGLLLVSEYCYIIELL